EPCAVAASFRRAFAEGAMPTKLPAGFASTGDPVDENPFPADSLKHQRWKHCTDFAEREIAKIRAEYLRLPPVPPAQSIGEMIYATEQMHQRMLTFIVNQFNI